MVLMIVAWKVFRKYQFFFVKNLDKGLFVQLSIRKVVLIKFEGNSVEFFIGGWKNVCVINVDFDRIVLGQISKDKKMVCKVIFNF